MTTSARNVNFGTGKTGLSTVGYRLVNTDGSIHQDRTTTGVVESFAGTGIYQAEISLPDTWKGTILWDTGEVSPKYAADVVNIIPVTGSSTFYTGAANVDAKGNEQLVKNVKTLIDQNKRIMAKVDDVHQTVVTQNTDAQKITEAVGKISSHLKSWPEVVQKIDDIRGLSLRENERGEDMKLRIEFMKGLIKESLVKDSEAMESLIETIAILIESQETRELIQEVQDVGEIV